MYSYKRVAYLVFLIMVCLLPNIGFTQANQPQYISLSAAIGPEIGLAERDAYGLFPDIKGFQSARIFILPDSTYRLEYTFKDAVGTHQKNRKLSTKAFEQTRLHIRLVEEHKSQEESSAANKDVEAEVTYRLGLKYAAQKRYNLATALFSELQQNYPESHWAVEAKSWHAGVDDLLRIKKALIWSGALLDQSGRAQVLVFSGYFGLWLGLATPIAFESESPQAYAAGLLLGAPLSLLLTHDLTKEADISTGRANMITLGGHLGTWQGLGWSLVSDTDGSTAVGVSELAGLAGIGAASLLTHSIDFSEGHAAVTSSGLQWGGWFGLVFGRIFGAENDGLLASSLIGSDIAILGAAVAAKNVRMSNARARLINLSGIVGTVFGFGIDLLFEVHDDGTILGIAGLGSAAGLALGTQLTRNYDKNRDLAAFYGNGIGIKLAQQNETKLRLGLSGLPINSPTLQNTTRVPSISMQMHFSL